MRLSEIGPRDLKEYAAKVAARGVSRDTIRLALAPVRLLLATAHEEDLIRSNPAAGLRLAQRTPSVDDGEAEKAKALTEDELGALLVEVAPRWRLLVAVLAQTGLRVSEALPLRWADIDFGRRRLSVRRGLARGQVGPPKTKHGRRDVRLSAGLARLLWEARKTAADGHDEGLVFPAASGGFLDRHQVFRAVKDAAKRAGVPWAGLHTLRHTAATIRFRRGWNAVQVQKFMGHHSPAFTLATYVHLLPEDLPDDDFSDGLLGVAEWTPVAVEDVAEVGS